MKIYQVKGRFVNSYIVLENGNMFVVDVALHGEKYVTEYIEHVLERDLNDVQLVVCTHDDPDHSGGIFALALDCKAKVGLPYASYLLIKKLWHNPAGLYYRGITAFREAMRPRMWKMYLNPKRYKQPKKKPADDVMFHSHLSDRSIAPDFRIKHKEPLLYFEDWLLLHTPGHSWDSSCYFHRPTRSLITGDTLLGSKKQNKVLLPAIYASPKQMARTIVLLKSLNPTGIYPGHGSCFRGEGLLNHL